jgi:hypothetical protein
LGRRVVERDESDGGREDDRESANELCTHGRNVPTDAVVRQSSMPLHTTPRLGAATG